MTNSEAIKRLKSILETDISDDEVLLFTEDYEAIDYAINALKQKPILDKIRDEIVHLHDWAFSREEILRIIDKYKAESEGKE